MKTVVIVADGLGDEPIADLDGQTPLEAAFAPHMHYIANRGQIGRLQTAVPGFPVESAVCIMGLLGYAPQTFYPHGRASFEAMAKGIPLAPDDLVLRCNTITVAPDGERLADFSAGLISDSVARVLIGQIRLPSATWELYPGQSYRNILIIRGAGIDPRELRCFEPHMHRGEAVRDLLPRAEGSAARELADALGAFLLDTQRQIAAAELGPGCTANMLWVWSPASKPEWPSFLSRTGRTAAVVGGLDFLHGIAMAARIHYDVIPGATGYVDTNYAAKAQFTTRYIDGHDFVLTHINATDEEAHRHNYVGKVAAVEAIDRLIVGPVLQHLVARGEAFRILICGDHATRCRDGKHTAAPVPFAVFGTGVHRSNAAGFSERVCAECAPRPSTEMLSEILWRS